MEALIFEVYGNVSFGATNKRMVWKVSQSLIRSEDEDRSSRPKETNDM